MITKPIAEIAHIIKSIFIHQTDELVENEVKHQVKKEAIDLEKHKRELITNKSDGATTRVNTEIDTKTLDAKSPQTPSSKLGSPVFASANISQSKNSKLVLNLTPRFPLTIQTNIGSITFSNPQRMGKLGEWMTHKRSAVIFKKTHKKMSPLKYDKIHGFDHVYFKKAKNGKYEVVIIESKVNKSPLGTISANGRKVQQLSDDYIKEIANRMINSGDPKLAENGNIILESLNAGMVKKEVWRYDLPSGTLNVSKLGKSADDIIEESVVSGDYVDNCLRKACGNSAYSCKVN